MKAYKTLTVITIILTIALITAVSIFGIYKQKEYKVSNILPDYTLGMEFNKGITLNLEVDTSIASETIYDKNGKVVESKEGKEYKEKDGYTTVEEKVNPDEILNKENFAKSKSIILSRLNSLRS